MFGLNKSEIKAIGLILFSIIALTLLNLQVSFRKARDSQRKTDLRNIYEAISRFQHDFGFLPLSTPDGQIIACQGTVTEKGEYHFEPCDWFFDKLVDSFDPTYPPYLDPIPTDPRHDDGYRYYYVSSGKHFQIYASLESSHQDEYDSSIAALDLPCGTQICNLGRASKDTPLDKLLEEYENELLQQDEK